MWKSIPVCIHSDWLLSTWHRPRYICDERLLSEKMLPEDWPLGKAVGAFFKLIINAGGTILLWAVSQLSRWSWTVQENRIVEPPWARSKRHFSVASVSVRSLNSGGSFPQWWRVIWALENKIHPFLLKLLWSQCFITRTESLTLIIEESVCTISIIFLLFLKGV